MIRGYISIILTILLAVALGWTAHGIYLQYTADDVEMPQQSTLSKVSNFLNAAELMSPQDRISEDDIFVYDNQVVIDVENPIWSSFTDTNSMDPLLDVGANGIEIIPKTENDVHVGDVISYKTESGIVIHRVVDIRSDEQGLYYVLKGDNNPVPDKERVRFKDIQGILVAVVY
jgi:hypothetical protein